MASPHPGEPPRPPDTRLTDPRRLGGAYQAVPHWQQVDLILGRPSRQRERRDRIRQRTPAAGPERRPRSRVWGTALDPTRLRLVAEASAALALVAAVVWVTWLLAY